MVASLQSPADVVNAALTRIGYRLRVSNLFDGSDAAKKALDIYGQTRDELLRQNDWGFAERNVAMTLLKSAPVSGYVPPNGWAGATNPPIPWAFEYAYPDDCLKVRAVKPTPIFIPPYDPAPYVYSVANDNYYSPARKVLLCNVVDAMLVYTGQVTNPSTWEADFTEAISAALARRLAAGLGGAELVKLEMTDEAMTQGVAEREQG